MAQESMEIALIKYNRKTWCKSALLGFFIGLAVIVPGISGSTVAIIFKLYDQFLYACLLYTSYKDGWYYYFGSSGTCCEELRSTYHVRVGRSKNPLGPYVDSRGRALAGAGNVGDTILAGAGNFVGPGHTVSYTHLDVYKRQVCGLAA